jgi:hypothetical protein
MEKHNYYPFSSEYHLYKNTVSLTVHDIIIIFFFAALDKDMSSQTGQR